MSVPDVFVDFGELRLVVPEREQSYLLELRRRELRNRRTRCHVCGSVCERELEPPFPGIPPELEADVHFVKQGNGLIVPACFACWFRWPDEWKIHGREWLLEIEPEPDRVPQASPISADRLVELLRETAP